MNRLWLVNCRDCGFRKVCRNSDKSEHMADSHEGRSQGHIVVEKGPFYHYRGNTKSRCQLCGFVDNDPDEVLGHIRDEHDTAPMFLEKTTEVSEE